MPTAARAALAAAGPAEEAALGLCGGVLMRCSAKPTEAQVECQRLIFDACAAAGAPPIDLLPAEALRALRIAGPYGDDFPQGPVSFDPALVSLPPEGSSAVPLSTLWGDGGLDFIARFVDTCWVPKEVAQERLK